MRHRLVLITLVASLTLGSAASAQSPSLAPVPRTEPPSTEATDGRLRLAVRADPTEAVVGDPITVTATLENLATDRLAVTLLQSQPVMFSVQQLDGPVDMVPDRGPVSQITLEPGASLTVPFAKAGGYDGNGPLATFWRDWFADPDLLLPAGAYRITATTAYATSDGATTTLQASVDLAVVNAPTPTMAAEVLGWEPITVSTGPTAPRLRDVIPYATGFLAAGTAGPRDRWAIWRSAGGRIGEIFVGQDRRIGTATAIVDGSVTDWSVVASADGDAWQAIGRWPGVPAGWIRAVETSTGLVAVGLGEARDWLAVWRSPDAVDWTELHRETGRWGVETVTAAGDAIVVGGLVLVDALADEDAPATLTTADGAGWTRTVGAPFASLSYPQDAAINGGAVVLLTEDRPGEPSAWRAEVGTP